jgi:hypothetical protein
MLIEFVITDTAILNLFVIFLLYFFVTRVLSFVKQSKRLGIGHRAQGMGRKEITYRNLRLSAFVCGFYTQLKTVVLHVKVGSASLTQI